MGPTDLNKIGDISAAPNYFARVTGLKAIDTGIQQITIRKRSGVETNRSVSGKYYALVIENRFLIVKSSSAVHATVEGELKAMPADLESKLFNAPPMQSIRNRFYPFYLDDASFRFSGYCGIVAFLVFGFSLVWLGFPAWRHLQNPSSHPVLYRVSSWGDSIGISVEAERESSTPRYFKSGWDWLLTDNYLIKSKFFTFDLLRFSDLLWAYKRVTKHKVNFIPTGKTYEAVLVCHGGTATANSEENTIDLILTFAAERAPWAVFGFSKELEQLFEKNNRDFCFAVEQRRRQGVKQTHV
jgi:hypothetical protein